METALQIIGAIVVVMAVVLAAAFFGIPGWAPGDRKPNTEAMMVIGVLLGCIVFVIIAAVAWEQFVR